MTANTPTSFPSFRGHIQNGPYLAAQLLEGAVVAGDVGSVLLLDHLEEVLHHTLVEVLSSQVSVTVCGQHLSKTTKKLQSTPVHDTDYQEKHMPSSTKKSTSLTDTISPKNTWQV